MNSVKKNSEIILASEEEFAYAVAKGVLDPPKLSIWMILIPIIIVFFMYRHQKYVDGRKSFVKNFLVSRKLALDAAVDAIQSGQKANVARAVGKANVPEDTRKDYAAWIRLLIEHYEHLLRCKSDAYDAMIKSAYKTRSNYLQYLSRLNNAEKQFNAVLKPHLQTTAKDVDEIIVRMESWSDKIRRAEAQRVFS